jgi:DNA-binding response OmpR family regulator
LTSLWSIFEVILPVSRILLVEDDPLSGRTLAAILRHFGHEVQLVTSVRAGLAGLLSEPDCVLLDLMLPDGDGALILARLHAANLRTRIAIITSNIDDQQREVFIRLGAGRIFRKPVNPDELLDWLADSNAIAPQNLANSEDLEHHPHQ